MLVFVKFLKLMAMRAGGGFTPPTIRKEQTLSSPRSIPPLYGGAGGGFTLPTTRKEQTPSSPPCTPPLYGGAGGGCTPPLYGGAGGGFPYGQLKKSKPKTSKYYSLKRCLSIFFATFFLSTASAQTEAVAQLDSNIAETGNPFIIHLLSPSPDGKPLQVDFSAWDTILPKENILSQSAAIRQGAQYQIDLTCITFDADTLLLPPLTIRLAGGKTALTNALQLIVLATPAPTDLNDMADLKDIRPEPILWTDYLPWILGVLGIVLVIFLANRWWKRRQQRGSRSREVAMPAHLLAQRKLEVLRKKHLWQAGQVKLYYAELTFIMREYLQKRYHIPALESTTEETLAYLQKKDFPVELRQTLAETLVQADLVKFAKSTPPESFHDEALRQAQLLVQATREEEIAVESSS